MIALETRNIWSHFSFYIFYIRIPSLSLELDNVENYQSVLL